MKYLLLLVCIISVLESNSQAYQVKKRPTFFINSASFDLKTIPEGRYHSLSDNYSGLGVSFWQGLAPHLDLSLAANFTRVFYPFRNGLNYRARRSLTEVDAAMNIKLLNDNHVVVPYLTAGIGLYVFANTNGSYAPFGAGLQFNIKHKIFIRSDFQYRAAVTKEGVSQLFYGLHVGLPLSKRRLSGSGGAIPGTIGSTISRSYDRDRDGVPDSIDNCPNTPGVAEFKGCPAPKDMDGDGIADSLDKCPTVAGVASRSGCPVPDTDNDGLDDDVDKCPNEAGPFSNGGCPVVEKKQPPVPTKQPVVQDTIAKPLLSFDVFFYSGLTVMPEASKKILASVADFMKRDPTAKAIITGYADDVEFEDAAILNSGRRATDVAANLIKMGIPKSRIVASGAGTTNPKASNETVIGRSQNRRVEIKVVN